MPINLFLMLTMVLTGLATSLTHAVETVNPVTEGGTGGHEIRVTSLGHGEGSLRDALGKKGPKTIVFEVAGVIDLQMESLELTTPFTTIDGESAPPPGITLIRGGISIRTHDVIVRHIRIRPGEAGAQKGSGWEADGLSTSTGAHHVIIDHCSFSWATDENLSASGPRFSGDTDSEWRDGTSHDIVFSHNIIAEGLSNSTHSKFEHSKGMLLHDNVTGVLIIGNLFAHNMERNPLLKGGAQAMMINNLIYNPGSRALHYNLLALEWGDRPRAPGQLTAVGNVMRAGPSTQPGLPFLMLGGQGDLHYYGEDNIAVDRLGNPLPRFGRYTTSKARVVEQDEPRLWPRGLNILPSGQVEEWILKNAGARPRDRDAHDQRIVSDVAEGRGRIIDSETEVGGYPDLPSPEFQR
jgi:pectate lyase